MPSTRPSQPSSATDPNAYPGAWLASGVLGLVAAGMLLSGCAVKEASEETPTVTVQVGAAENKPINREVRGEAILYPRDQAAIIPRVNAPIAKFYVDRGSPVHAGQVLAELENRDLASAVDDNQAAYQQAEAGYQTVAQKTQQELKLAKQELDAAQRTFDNRESLLKQGAASMKDVEDARIALTQAQDQYEVAQKQFDLQAAEGQRASAKAKVAGAETQLSYTKIVSPINGVVTDRPVYLVKCPPRAPHSHGDGFIAGHCAHPRFAAGGSAAKARRRRIGHRARWRFGSGQGYPGEPLA